MALPSMPKDHHPNNATKSPLGQQHRSLDDSKQLASFSYTTHSDFHPSMSKHETSFSPERQSSSTVLLQELQHHLPKDEANDMSNSIDTTATPEGRPSNETPQSDAATRKKQYAASPPFSNNERSWACDRCKQSGDWVRALANEPK